MMLIIHGDDLELSRKALIEQRAKFFEAEVVVLNGKKLTITDLTQALEATSLFTTDKLVVIENILSVGVLKVDKQILSYLSGFHSDSNLIIYEEKEISAGTISKYFPKAKTLKFALPQVIFQFVESLGISNPQTLLSLYHTLLEQKEAEFIYAMIVRQISFLIIAKDLGREGLSDISPWQAGKFVTQARAFELSKLITLYRQLVSIDYKIKSGTAPFQMSTLLDFFLTTI